MKIITNGPVIALIVSVILLCAAGSATGQKDSTPKKRLKSSVAVSGYIGGEAHDSYVIRARKGQAMTVQLYWNCEEDNRAEFSVSRSADFFDSEPVKFGKESVDGKQLSGEIPETGDYYIYVVAHPAADYTIKVTVK